MTHFPAHLCNCSHLLSTLTHTPEITFNVSVIFQRCYGFFKLPLPRITFVWYFCLRLKTLRDSKISFVALMNEQWVSMCLNQGVLSCVYICVFYQACRCITVLLLWLLPQLSWALCAKFPVTSVVSDHNSALNPTLGWFPRYNENGDNDW